MAELVREKFGIGRNDPCFCRSGKLEVISGHRYVIVSWAAYRESLRVRDEPCRAAIFID